ncbi:MAG: HlyD family type I secretion periplasmic adaptor subunit [Geminicoccaceae bacterium]
MRAATAIEGRAMRSDPIAAAAAIGGYTVEDLRPKRLSHVLLLAIVTFFAVFLGWASRATLDEVTRGEGRVISSQQTQVVQNLEGGIVAALLANEGDIVDAGQVLMRIDNVRAASDFREHLARSYALRAGLARLEAEVNETALEFPPDILAEARDIANAETRLFQSRQEELQTELEILRRQAEQREQELAELQTRSDQYEESLRLAREELRILTPLAERRVVSQSELLQLQRQVNDLDGQLGQTKLAIPRIEAAVREAHQRIENAFSTFRSEAYREMSALQSELAGIKEVITAGEDRVRRTEVRSPVRGTVKQLHFNTIGGVIQPGDAIVEITPLEDTLLVEARVRPADIAFLRPDLPAMVKITAYDFSIYGGLKGHVEQISADTIVDERGERFYRVRVRTEENSLGTAADPLRIIPGMTAQVDVITGEKTVLDYLLKPILKARDHALRER